MEPDNTFTRRVCAVLLADVTGFSKLMGENDERTAHAVHHLQSIAQGIVGEHGGRAEPVAGDALFATFDSVVAAVQAAVTLQRRIADAPFEGQPLQIRIGVHLGDVLLRDGRAFGDAINIAARLESLARPGTICISEGVYRQVRGTLEEKFVDLGRQKLKNISDPVQAYLIVPSGALGPLPRRRSRRWIAAAAALALLAVAAVFAWRHQQTAAPAVEVPALGAEASTKASLTVEGFANRPAIAVLPFDNLSGDAAQEYFADGLAEDLITRLSLWRSFPVIARNSSFVYKGKAVDLKQVSADLGVRYVVEGSVRKAGDRVRIAAQLIDATSGQHVWAETYDRELTDVFAVQDEISSAIAASLVGDLQRAEEMRAERRAPQNLEAWGLYQRAKPLVYNFTRQDNAEARTLLERAIAIEPQFGAARALLAETLYWAVQFGWAESPSETVDVALTEARRAVALDPRDAQAHFELANVMLLTAGVDEVLEEARRAADLNPSDPLGLNLLAWTLTAAGHPPEESIALVQRAMRLSPHDPREFMFYDTLGPAYFNAGRYAEGLAAARRLIDLRPTYYYGYLYGAMNAVGLGRTEEAHEFIRQARGVEPEMSFAFAHRGMGAMSPEVDQRISAALRQAGLE